MRRFSLSRNNALRSVSLRTDRNDKGDAAMSAILDKPETEECELWSGGIECLTCWCGDGRAPIPRCICDSCCTFDEFTSDQSYETYLACVENAIYRDEHKAYEYYLEKLHIEIDSLRHAEIMNTWSMPPA
jgi:hypothetical protein